MLDLVVAQTGLVVTLCSLTLNGLTTSISIMVLASRTCRQSAMSVVGGTAWSMGFNALLCATRTHALDVMIYDTTVRYVQFTNSIMFTTENFLFLMSAASLALNYNKEIN